MTIPVITNKGMESFGMRFMHSTSHLFTQDTIESATGEFCITSESKAGLILCVEG